MFIIEQLMILFLFSDIDECSSDTTHNCEQVCVNSEGSYTCSCNDGFTLQSDLQSCQPDPTTSSPTSPTTATTLTPASETTTSSTPTDDDALCGGTLTAASGSFQTPGWPDDYPQEDFQCEWTIDVSASGYGIRFTINETAYGINGRDPCTRDAIEFFDGINSSAASIHRLCQFDNPGPFTTSSSQAFVVFTATRNLHRPASRVGVRVEYTTEDISTYIHSFLCPRQLTFLQKTLRSTQSDLCVSVIMDS